MEERLSKLIALAGLASRREADRLVRGGMVSVNGAVIENPGHRVDPDTDHIKVEGKLITRLAPPVYLAIHKPKGVLSTTSDAEGRPTVASQLKGIKGRLLSIARLDAADEGLLVLTSDRELSQRLNDPRSGIIKTYLVKVRGIPDEKVLARLRTGVPIQGGRTLPMKVRIVSVSSKNAWLQVTLQESRQHLLKLMTMKLRHPAVKVKRTQFGPISIRGLAPGSYRKLTEDEVAQLRALAENPPGLPERLSGEALDAARASQPEEKPRRGRGKGRGALKARSQGAAPGKKA